MAVSSLVPIVNVDLLVRDEQGRILLSWRDDPFFGKGWHLPGGCIRFKETMEERVRQTAMKELHAEVIYERKPIAIRDVILEKDSEFPKLRAHHVAILFSCKILENYMVDNRDLSEKDAGFLKWFLKMPDELLKVHDCYRDIFEQMGLYET